MEHGTDDSFQLLKEVRADSGLADTLFIIVTAESKTANVVAAMKAGVNNYIIKPFDAQTLKTKIEAVFSAKPFSDEFERMKFASSAHCSGGQGKRL